VLVESLLRTKTKGTAMRDALFTGLAPPAFTAPCRNQTGDCEDQSQGVCLHENVNIWPDVR
jgi:hypothetical protein